MFATLITYHAKVKELFDLDLTYAPPFSTTKDPVYYPGMILDNAIHGGRPLITEKQLDELQKKESIRVIDARNPSDYEKKKHLDGAKNLLEDAYGLKIGEIEGELCLRLDRHNKSYPSMFDMFHAWQQQAQKLRGEELSDEGYNLNSSKKLH